MNRLEYKLEKNSPLHRWSLSEIFKTPFTSPEATFEAPINLEENYVQIIYPIREYFLAQYDLEKIRYPAVEYKQIYFPFENSKVDFTTFEHRPQHMWFYGKTFIEVETKGKYAFDLSTCGGCKIWVNQNPAVMFQPFTRNIPASTTILLDLEQGENEIVMYCDELAERDVFFYFELRYKGETAILNYLPVQEPVHLIQQAEAFLTSCYFPKDCFKTDHVLLGYDKSLVGSKLEIEVTVNSDLGKQLFYSLEEKVAQITQISPLESLVCLGRVEDFKKGAYNVFVSMQIGKISIHRGLVLGIMPEAITAIQGQENMEGRKQQALDFICKYGEKTICKTMTLLKQEKRWSTEAEESYKNSLEIIEHKEDCADFYLVPLLGFLKKDASHLPEDLYQRTKLAILDFRYWIDEPGNDVMWYFSENHAFLFHIAQYLAGDLFRAETFVRSQKSGVEQKEIGRKRILAWFEHFSAYGYAEWNSATYIPIDLLGLFTLFEVAPDRDIRDLAKKALDFSFEIIAVNSFAGVMSSSYGRAYEDTLKSREQLETSFLTWVAYNDGFVNFRTRSVTLFCLSSYAPPVWKDFLTLPEDQALCCQLDQGIKQIKTYSFRTNFYFMASVRRFRPFFHGHQQHVMNVALGDRPTQYFINHPGEPAFSGGNRPAYWAGNGTVPLVEQVNNTILMIYQIQAEELVHQIHSYCVLDELDEYVCQDKWFFARMGDSYLANYFSEGFHLTEKGANCRKELVALGLQHGLVIKCGSKAEFSSFSHFVLKLKQQKIDFNPSKGLVFEDPQWGRLELLKDPIQLLCRGQVREDVSYPVLSSEKIHIRMVGEENEK